MRIDIKKRTLMLIYVRISEPLKGKVDQLVARGHYSDFSAAVNVALENLLIAEEEHPFPGQTTPAAPNAMTTRKEAKPNASPSPDAPRIAKGTERKITAKSDAVFKWAAPPSISDELVV